MSTPETISIARVDAARGTPLQQALLCLALFGAAYSCNTVAPLLVFYTENLHLAVSTLTWFFTAYAGGVIVALPFAGALSDRHGRKAVVVPSMVLFVLAAVTLLLGAAWGAGWILAGRFLQGIAGGAAYAAGTVWLRELSGSAHAARAAMRATASMAFGFAIGPLIGGICVEWLPAPKVVLLLVALALVLMATGIVLRLPETLAPHGAMQLRIGLPRGTGRGFAGYLAPCALLAYTFVMLAMIAFPVQLANAGFRAVYFVQGVSLMLVLGAATIATGWAHRLGAATAGWASAAAGALGCGLGYIAVQPGNWPWILPASVLIGIGSGLSITGGVIASDRLAPPERRGQLLSLFYVVAYVGFSSPTLLSVILGKGVMERGSTILGLGVAAIVLGGVLLGPGRAALARIPVGTSR